MLNLGIIVFKILLCLKLSKTSYLTDCWCFLVSWLKISNYTLCVFMIDELFCMYLGSLNNAAYSFRFRQGLHFFRENERVKKI